jgi:F0F1-type ATP synthase assembly protein I
MKPLSQTAGGNNKATPISKDQARQLFISAALNMSWQMAIAVLVPILGGYELDKSLKSSPAFTIVGLVIAMILCALVVGRALKASTPPQDGGSK